MREENAAQGASPCYCCTDISNDLYEDMIDTMTNLRVFYAPDNTLCKQTTYQVVESGQITIKAAVQKDDKFRVHIAADLFQNIPSTVCPLSDSEISKIYYEILDADGLRIPDKLKQIININSEGSIMIYQEFYDTWSNYNLILKSTSSYGQVLTKEIEI